MKIRNYNLFVHALHSRLQLIRNKLDVASTMTPSEVVIKNRKFFDKAAESVQAHHNYQCDRMDFYNAAELFLTSLDSLEKEILEQPFWKRQEDINKLEL